MESKRGSVTLQREFFEVNELEVIEEEYGGTANEENEGEKQNYYDSDDSDLSDLDGYMHDSDI